MWGKCCEDCICLLNIYRKHYVICSLQSNWWITNEAWMLSAEDRNLFEALIRGPPSMITKLPEKVNIHTVMKEGNTTPQHIWVHSSCLVAQQGNSSQARRKAADTAPPPQLWLNHTNFTRTNPYVTSTWLSFAIVVPQFAFLSVWWNTSSFSLASKKELVYFLPRAEYCNG